MAPRGETDHWFTVFAVAILCVITLVVYGQIVFFDFVNYDDPFFISLNPHVMSGLTRDNILWAFSTSDMGIWHPLTWMSYQLEISVFGAGNPGSHHAVNLFLHVSNAVLVLLLFTRLTGKLWASLLVAVLFSIHPQHVQPVAWIAERKEVLAAVFFLLSVYLYAGHRCQPGTKGTYLASLAVFGVALMCKPSVAPLPVILILVDLYCRYPNNERGLVLMAPAALAAARFKHLLSNKIPFFLLSAIVSVITIYIKKTGHWAGYEESLHLGRRLLLMPIGFMHYLKTLVVPWPNPLWIEAPEGMPYLQSLLSAAVIGVLGFVIWRARGRFPQLGFGALWFVVMWLPVSGIVLVSNYYVADRYTYLPYIGGLFALVFFAKAVFISVLHGPRLMAALTVVVASAGGVLAYQQTSYWRDSITFFEREMEINPDSAKAPLYIGQALLEQDKNEQALAQFLGALERDASQSVGHALKGDALRKLGRVDEAIAAYREAVALRYHRGDAYVYLGLLLIEKGRVTDGVAVMEEGLDRFPDDTYLLSHLAYTYGFTLDKSEKSRAYYERVLQLDSADSHALHGMGVIYLRDGQIEKGITKLEKLLQLEPDNEEARKLIRDYKTQ
ncbi:tetratricopeptide repeat protein [Gammaproteobacteria bacterium]|nr:tetratricopeptide repeat protein [Gammaproteobacteria bacterium]